MIAQYWGTAKSSAKIAIAHDHNMKLVEVLADETVSVAVTAALLNSWYSAPMGAELNRVVGQLSGPSWSGNGVPDYGADAYAQQAVNDLWRITRYRHAEARSTLVGIKAGHFIDKMVSALSKLNKAYLISNVVNTVVRNAILWATIIDVGSDAMKFIKYQEVVDHIIVGPSSGWGPALASSAGPAGGRGLSSSRLDARGLRLLAESAEANSESFEAAAREMEAALVASDTAAARLLVDSLSAKESELDRDVNQLSVPLLAAQQDAHYHIPEYGAQVDSAMNRASGSGGDRATALETVSEWLSDGSNDSLRLAALDQLRQAIDQTSASPQSLVQLTANVLGESASPFLSLQGPEVSPMAREADSLTVSVTVRNLGAPMSIRGG